MLLASRRVLGLLILSTLFWGIGASETFAQVPAPIELSRRRELFIDDYLISEMKHTQLLVHQPVREEIVAECDAPWEGNGCGYYSVLFDAKDSIYRMYYHAWQIATGVKGEEPNFPLTIAYRQSRDGIVWERPNLGLCDFGGSKDNNIILDRMGDGSQCHDFCRLADRQARLTESLDAGSRSLFAGV